MLQRKSIRTSKVVLRLAASCLGLGLPWLAPADDAAGLTIFLAGDVMTGRGIDQIMPTSVDPQLHEPFVNSALHYVEFAEEESGPIPDEVEPAYIWGDALDALQEVSPRLRAINLETAVTTSDDYWEDKGIHYRMHPANVNVLTAAGIDMCSVANNHILDWGYSGLTETLESLRSAGIAAVGAGENLAAAAEPASVELPGGGRILFFACALRSSGIPEEWAAGPEQTGLYLIEDPASDGLTSLRTRIQETATEKDIVIVSIHWGPNWGYYVPWTHKRLAHGLIDAGVDVVHGHSAHHAMGVEVYKQRLVLYGAGDLINDYEGIGNHEDYRPDLSLMYFPKLDPQTGALLELRMLPMQMRRFQLRRAETKDARWLEGMLDREGKALGTSAALAGDGVLLLDWAR